LALSTFAENEQISLFWGFYFAPRLQLSKFSRESSSAGGILLEFFGVTLSPARIFWYPHLHRWLLSDSIFGQKALRPRAARALCSAARARARRARWRHPEPATFVKFPPFVDTWQLS
jgi:hypothetical protein